MAQWPFPWYMAESLEVLRRQLNALAPGRSTASDGGIGDAAHTARVSDHNPNSYKRSDGARQVCARDFTHDPGDLDCQWLADQLIASSAVRIKYVIWNGRIWTPGVGWKPYTGDNPHTKHLHLSVRAGETGDDDQAWNLGGTPDQEDELTPDEKLMLKRIYGQLTGTEDVKAGFPGFSSKKYPHIKLTPVDFLRESNKDAIDFKQEHDNRFAAIEKAQAELAAKLDRVLTAIAAKA
ncbi:hypothetical protein [Amycolatopsis sp. NPDC052450]|uniref:hypothetical protein n=1 Tax=Amycolatopsis sp. NPDC052450 TaxID=3363937 RepID=UPI0037C8D000